MRPALPAAAAVLLLAAADEPRQAESAPAAPETRILPQESEGYGYADESCRDTVQMARSERGLPRLDREPASPGDAMAILAVDRQIDGCDVLVMASDPNDIRPLPRLDPEAPLLKPAQ